VQGARLVEMLLEVQPERLDWVFLLRCLDAPTRWSI